jgi:hypothetical protein
VSVDNVDDVVALTKWLGGQEAGVLTPYLKMLDARFLTSRRHFDRSPGFLWRLFNPALRLMDAVRRTDAGAVSFSETADFDERFDPLLARALGESSVTIERDRGYLRWRWGPGSPQAARRLAVAQDPGGDLLGYAVFMRSPGRNRTGQLFDVQYDPAQTPEAISRVLSGLLGYVVRQLRRDGAWSIRTYRFGSRAPQVDAALKHWGFISRESPTLRLRLLVGAADPERLKLLSDAGSWGFSWGDCELSYAGRRAFTTEFTA